MCYLIPDLGLSLSPFPLLSRVSSPGGGRGVKHGANSGDGRRVKHIRQNTVVVKEGETMTVVFSPFWFLIWGDLLGEEGKSQNI